MQKEKLIIDTENTLRVAIALSEEINEKVKESRDVDDDVDLLSPKGQWIWDKREHLVMFFKDAFATLVDLELSKFSRAQKLALYCLADSQRMRSDLLVALFIDAPKDEVTRK